ncbi:MAG TPA: hypothetical protein VNL92_07000, partial [Dehalococcoidia bacterium]|nr:hypothetical protein [Dehalococcoidia bacterium]
VAPPVAPSDGLAAETDRAWPRNSEVAAELARAGMEGRTVTLMVVEAEARAWDDRLPSLRALAQVVEETTAGGARVVSDQGARLAVLLDGAEAAAAHELAQDLCRQAAERGATGLRAGIAQFPRDGARPEDVIREAAEALAFAREAQLPVASSVLMG